MKQEEFNDFVNGVLSEYIFKTMKDDESIYVYREKDGYFENGEAQMKYICANTDGVRNPSSHAILKFNIVGRTYINRESFVSPVGFINLGNGVLNKDTMELVERSPSYNFQEKIPINYDTKAKCPMFDKFISDVIPKGDIKLIQKWTGYHFVHDNREKKFMLLVGIKHSGKSLYLRILETLIGINNCTHFELRDFDNNMSHSIPSLYGKIANTYADMSMKMLKDVGKIKVLTGNDFISTRYHCKEPFSFKPYTKITVSTNKCPHINDAVREDDAYWSRVLLCQFNIPKYGIPDKTLGDKIINNEMSGILNWALEGYKMVLEEGFEDYPASRSKLIWINSAMFIEEVSKKINDIPDFTNRSLFNDHGVPTELIQQI